MIPKVRNFMVLPALPDSLKDLEVIARNMFWSWNSEFEDLFRRIDPNLWSACGHNPVKLLGSISQESLEVLAENQSFVCELQRAADKLRSYLNGATWYEQVCDKNNCSSIAYFSAEFGLHEALPIYAGGLGLLAGDYLKSASDLGVPLVGIGLLYQKGYFRQYLNIDGWQQEVYVENDFYNMPVELIRNNDGQPLTVSVEYPGRNVLSQIWCVYIGRVKLYLLDTNIVANSADDRLITANLYGGDRETRMRQEIMLGIGGFRVLSVLGIKPSVCHMNEGHAAFMALERIRQLRASENVAFDDAMEATKSANVFTTHTPVKAGLDEFPPEMMEKYFANYFPALGIDKNRFLELGRVNPGNDTESFKMPILALKLSSYRNGVSKLHGQVSREMWSSLWPNVPVEEVPLISITNGVHLKSWLSDEMNALYGIYLGPGWAEENVNNNAMWKNIDQIPDEEFWRTHQRCKGHLIAFTRSRLKAQIQRRGTYHTELNWAEEVLDPEALTIGFARRFASYKRGNLLLKDPNRLVALLSSQTRPVQLIFAGKAHPRDMEGKEIIRQIIHFTSQYEIRRRIVFLEDYDINVAKVLVRGVDIWLNNPRRPMEASGTSGMKAAINGALNISTLDGWWCEGYRPDGGWVIGAGESYEDAAYQDTVESQAIYNILENEVVPLFYTRSVDNLPRAWIHRIKNSIKWITPMFNTHRMVGEYMRRFYNPAASKWRYLTADSLANVKNLSMWEAKIKNAWHEFAIKDVEVSLNGNGQTGLQLNPRLLQLKVGSVLKIKALVRLGPVSPNDVSIELYHGLVDAWGDIKDGFVTKMNCEPQSNHDGDYWFTGQMSCRNSGRQGVAVRLLPKHYDLVSPLDMGLILWETPSAKSFSDAN